jgi:hypothetical protein
MPCAAQGCKDWTEVLAKSFFPRQVDEQRLREFANYSPQQYFQVVSQEEEKGLADLTQSFRFEQSSLNSYNEQARLRSTLAQFYRVGSQLYGVKLNPDNVRIAPVAELNAFASGAHVFMHAGLIEYFLNPVDYVAQLVTPQGGQLTSEQYQRLQTILPWQNDWDSIYYVLAHEASHNLMRHRDQGALGHVQKMFEDYQQSVTNFRRDVAHGRGGGVKKYLWQSLKNFTEELQSAEEQRGKEAEADAVALLLLQHSGFNPETTLIAEQRMDLLLGGGLANGWQAGMTEVLCSTHPGWIERIQKTQTQLNCLRSSGNLCEAHITYPTEDSLSQLHEGMARLDKYQEETLRITEGSSSPSAQVFEGEVKVDPKDAELRVDGKPASPGRVQLPVGPHSLHVTKDGYGPQDLQIVVFPDVQPKVKIKLKKLGR